MYNADNKEAFLDWFSTNVATRKTMRVSLNALEPIEEKYNADICTLDYEIIKDAIPPLLGLKRTSRLLRLNHYQEYVKWCIANNVSGACDAMLKLTPNDGIDESVRQRMVFGPDHLQVQLDLVFCPENQKTIDNIYRCYYWLAFANIREDEILKVKKSDVDIKNMIVTVGDNEYVIYHQGLEAVKNCVELSSFLYINPAINTKNEIWMPRVDNDLLISGIKTIITVKSMRTYLTQKSLDARSSGKTNFRLNYSGVQLSGMFYRIYELERKGIKVDFTGIIADELDYKNKLSDNPKTYTKKYIVDMARRRQEDYESWKRAFII